MKKTILKTLVVLTVVTFAAVVSPPLYAAYELTNREVPVSEGVTEKVVDVFYNGSYVSTWYPHLKNTGIWGKTYEQQMGYVSGTLNDNLGYGGMKWHMANEQEAAFLSAAFMNINDGIVFKDSFEPTYWWHDEEEDVAEASWASRIDEPGYYYEGPYGEDLVLVGGHMRYEFIYSDYSGYGSGVWVGLDYDPDVFNEWETLSTFILADNASGQAEAQSYISTAIADLLDTAGLTGDYYAAQFADLVDLYLDADPSASLEIDDIVWRYTDAEFSGKTKGETWQDGGTYYIALGSGLYGGPLGGGAVPEPSAVALLAFAAGVILRKKRRIELGNGN